MPTRSETYCFFRLGLVTGLVEPAEVIAWADGQLLANPEADYDLVELSMAANWPHSKLIWLLNRLQGWPEMAVPLALLVERAGQHLAADPGGAYPIGMGLRLLSAEERLPSALRKKLAGFENDLDAYRNGQISLEELAAALQSILEG
jgi:hypothetical protein